MARGRCFRSCAGARRRADFPFWRELVRDRSPVQFTSLFADL
jgi:hypothetical protein